LILSERTPRGLIDLPEANLLDRSWVFVDQLRSISTDRFGTRIGRVSQATATAADDRLRQLFVR
jgi:mRNA-degrading endonuclease toxin of MazEF toxin-antitoxin module